MDYGLCILKAASHSAHYNNETTFCPRKSLPMICQLLVTFVRHSPSAILPLLPAPLRSSLLSPLSESHDFFMAGRCD